MKLLLENWREYLDEVERFPDIATSQDKIQQSLDYFYQEHAPKIGKREDLGDWMGHKMVKFALPNREAFFFAVDGEDKAKAYIAIEPFKEGYSVGNVRKTKGGGFSAPDLYKWLARQFGSLYSDSKQTTAGEGIWKRLQQDTEVNVEEPSEKTGGRWRLSK